MKAFALPEPTTMKVLGVNVRSELHGKFHVPAVDLKLELTTSNVMLDQLKGPELRQMLYMAATADTQVEQPELDGVVPLTDTPLLRIKGLEPLRLSDDLSGYTVTVDLGLGRKESQVELTGCKVNAFSITALQGGSVKIGFRVQASHLKEREIGKLGVLIDTETSIKLEPPLVTEAIDGTDADEEEHEPTAVHAQKSRLKSKMKLAADRVAKREAAVAKKTRH